MRRARSTSPTRSTRCAPRAATFLDALKNTGSSARVTQFATVSAELAPSTLVDDASMGQSSALGKALTGYYNPRPPQPNNVNFYR